MSTPDIFLSYNREDADIARAYAEAFAREGLDVWWDATLRSGEAYDKVTEAALRGARVVVVLWSPRSVESRWVRAEATIADRNKTLMPVTIEPYERPVMFELTQTAELSHWRGAADDRAWLAFLDDVRRMVGRGSAEPVDAAPPTAPATTLSGSSRVAVLPVTHRGGEVGLELLAEDLTEDITRELPRSSYFKVIAAGTMAAWRGQSVDYQALGRQLQARYLVEGKLQRNGDNIRLTVQLIDTGTASTVWSNRFVRDAADIAASSEEFTVSVASHLREQITQSEFNRAMAKPGPLSGWEHSLRATSLWHRIGSDNLLSAIEEARKAVSIAPGLGLAHATLAGALSGTAM